MTHPLHDLVRHNAWATKRLLAFCRDLDDATLALTVPGTYGTIRQTLRHIIDSEMSYLFRASGIWKERPWVASESVSLEVLDDRAALLAETWETYLATGVDVDAEGEARGGDGTVFAVRHGVFITQAFHHANEHRAQICTILGANGIEPPEVSGWLYGLESGRSTIVSTPGDA